MIAKRSIRESTGRWIFNSVEATGMKNSIARKPARIHGSGRLVWGKASRGGAGSSLAATARPRASGHPGTAGGRPGTTGGGTGTPPSPAVTAAVATATTYPAGCGGDALTVFRRPRLGVRCASDALTVVRRPKLGVRCASDALTVRSVS
jgi:hypothetical protein